jgi:hypothetical protein
MRRLLPASCNGMHILGWQVVLPGMQSSASLNFVAGSILLFAGLERHLRGVVICRATMPRIKT